MVIENAVLSMIVIWGSAMPIRETLDRYTDKCSRSLICKRRILSSLPEGRFHSQTYAIASCCSPYLWLLYPRATLTNLNSTKQLDVAIMGAVTDLVVQRAKDSLLVDCEPISSTVTWPKNKILYATRYKRRRGKKKKREKGRSLHFQTSTLTNHN